MVTITTTIIAFAMTTLMMIATICDDGDMAVVVVGAQVRSIRGGCNRGGCDVRKVVLKKQIESFLNCSSPDNPTSSTHWADGSEGCFN